MGIAFPLTPAPEKQKSPLLPAADSFCLPGFFNASVLQMSISFALKISAGIRPRFPSKARLSSGCIGSVPLQNRLAAGRQWCASPLSIAAVHHRDVGTGCTRSRLTDKTKATSFRLSTTVGRLCFGHYDIFSLMLGQDARADTIPFYADSPGSFLHLQKRCDTDNPRICYCGF